VKLTIPFLEMTALSSQDSLRIQKRVDEWRLKLIDLSKRNKAIFFLPSKTSTLNIISPDLDEIFSRLVVKERAWEIWQPPINGDKITQEAVRPKKTTAILPGWSDVTQLDKILKNLKRRSSIEYTERGIRILFLTYGLLKWIDKETKQETLSPLLMTPVELIKESARSPYYIKVPPVEESIIVNPALKLKLKFDYDIEIPDFSNEEDDSLSTYFEKLDFINKEFLWSIEKSCYLGLFSFSKLAIYQDLIDNFEIIEKHPIIRSLSKVTVYNLIQKNLPKLEDLDNKLDPEKTFQILDADSSQQLCIQYALQGQSFIMHGPPGTGKSQTIANIISEYIASGKSILFVSEKMAALDVVYNRLKEKNLDEYCLELHSYKANKREVINELNRALTEHLKPDKALSPDEVDRLKTRKNQLNEYSKALHKIREPSKYSMYNVLNELSKLKEIPDIPSEYPFFTTLNQSKIFAIEENIRKLSNNWIVIEEGAKFPWKDVKLEKHSNEIQTSWKNLLNTLKNSITSINVKAEEFCSKTNTKIPQKIVDYDDLLRLSNIIAISPYPPKDWFFTTDLQHLKSEAEKSKIAWTQYWKIRDDLEKKYDNRFRALPEGTSDLILNAMTDTVQYLKTPTQSDGSLLQNLDALNKFLLKTVKNIDTWKNVTEKITEYLEIKLDHLTINKIQQIQKLNDLLETPNKPERSWLERSNLEKVEEAYNKSKNDYEKRNEFRTKLENYTEMVLDLDLDIIITYLEGPGSSFFKFLRPNYYRIIDTISKTVKNGRVPASVLEDLKIAKELKSINNVLKSEQENLKKIMGSYYKEEIDFDNSYRAIKNARQILEIIGNQRASKILRDNYCIGGTPERELIENSKTIKESYSEWRADANHLKELIPEKIPNTNNKLTEVSLDILKEWAIETNRRLIILKEQSQPALITKKFDDLTDYYQLINELKNSEKLNDFEQEESRTSSHYTENYGNLYHGISTDWSKIINAIDWTRGFLNILKSAPSAELLQYVTDQTLIQPEFKAEEELNLIKQSIYDINNRFTKPFWSGIIADLNTNELLLQTNQLIDRIDDLQFWFDFKEISQKLFDEGLEKFVKQICERRIKKDLLVDVYTKAIFNGLFAHFLVEDDTLRKFRGNNHDQIVEDFIALDKLLIEKAPNKVIDYANTNKPQGIFIEAPDSEISVLLREAAKKRRQMPVRHLFDKIPNLIRKLKPCLLMSPISVSQFIIPERIHFDLVVFDEASQIFTEDAVGAIYRGDCLIVAGDNKQLPPTPFFQYLTDTDVEWDESVEDIGVFDSVLDECFSIGLPVKMLQWHYRSKHDSLISFSNNEFYDGKLILFPSAINKGEELGIEFSYVSDGLYDRGGTRTNIREAQNVVDLVFKHFKETPNKSLGIVTFSINQMNCVKDEIEARLKIDDEYEKLLKEDRLQGFFVKNLENVQGDERDVMIISVGYGYDNNGLMTLNFGPLNKEGGERRLNVAITRAKEKVILVSSIKSNDIDLSSTNSVGVKSLHDYLQYAEKQSLLQIEEKTEETKDVPSIINDIAEEIHKLGYSPILNVGKSRLKIDLGVKTIIDPEKFILGIIIDGENYSTIPTTRDRDRLRVQILKNMGWNIHRIWSPEWVQRRVSEIERLTIALKQAESGGSNRKVKLNVPKNNKKVERQVITEFEASKLPGAENYEVAKLLPKIFFNKIPVDQKKLYLRYYYQEISHLIQNLVLTENPIHTDLAFKRLNTALKLKPVTSAHRKLFTDLIEQQTRNGKLVKIGGFLWSSNNALVKIRIPKSNSPNTFRKIEHISPEELTITIQYILEHSLGLNKNAIIQTMTKTYKIKQTQETYNIISSIIYKMVNNHQIIFNNDLYFINKI